MLQARNDVVRFRFRVEVDWAEIQGDDGCFVSYLEKLKVRLWCTIISVLNTDICESLNSILKQDHQRWGYSTVERFEKR